MTPTEPTHAATPSPATTPIVCFSHLRWDFVYQRPQQVLSRLAVRRPVLYVEEPVPTDGAPRLQVRRAATNVMVLVPHLHVDECAPGNPAGEARLRTLLAPELSRIAHGHGGPPILWYYTPMALDFSAGHASSLVVYDCMDELANFRYAPPALVERERELLRRADLVFTGGHSLYEAKRLQHPNVHAFPSSVDLGHFSVARRPRLDPIDLERIPRPRIGYYGVIDERIDLGLLAEVAERRPEWQWILIGPTAKIDPAVLPRRANLHYLGPKSYRELPAYLGGWDAAMMPFVLDESTRYISPTKTPEYLAGGCAVASTPIADVAYEWGGDGPVHIGHGTNGFIAAVAAALADAARSETLCARADRLLHGLSWQRTCDSMERLLVERLSARSPAARMPPSVAEPA